MNLESTITLIITIVTAIPAFVALYRDKRTRIFFFKIESEKIDEAKLSAIKDLDPEALVWPTRKNIFFIEGIFVCLGKNDIKKEDIHKEIRISHVDKNAEFYSPKVIEEIDEVEASISKEKKSLKVSFPLLRNEESFTVQFYSNLSDEGLNFNHRIANVANIIVAKSKIHTKYINVLILAFVLFAGSIYWTQKNDIFTLRPIDLYAKYYNVSDGTMIAMDTIRYTDTTYDESTAYIITREKIISQIDTNKKMLVRNYSTLDMIRIDTTEYLPVGDEYYAQYKLRNVSQKVSNMVLSILWTSLSSFILMFSVSRLVNYYKAAKIAITYNE